MRARWTLRFMSMVSPLSRLVALLALAAGVSVLASVSAPGDVAGFDHPGEALNVSQRTFRVFNNFSDPTANDNQTPDPDFPGATEAVQVIWKAHLEWASEAFMLTGDQDPTQATLGDGGANFDNSFQGTTFSPGPPNDNVRSPTRGFESNMLLDRHRSVAFDGHRVRGMRRALGEAND